MAKLKVDIIKKIYGVKNAILQFEILLFLIFILFLHV